MRGARRLLAACVLLVACDRDDDQSLLDHHLPAPVSATVRTARSSDAYIVLLRDSVSDAVGTSKQLAALVSSRPERTFTRAVKGFSAHLNESALRALRDHPLVRHIEPDAALDLAETQTPVVWGLDRVDQRAATNNTYTYAGTGAGVTAYILDSGIRFDHADFTTSATDVRSRATLGVDLVGDGKNGSDCFGHGTHVAGTLGGRIHGVAKQVTLKVVRMFDCAGAGTVSGAIAGLDWMIADHAQGAPAIANLSIGGDPSQALDDAVARTIADGITVVVAAGNSSGDACGSSPASVAAAITVGATTFDDSRATFSNFGTCVDLYAPGHAIQSAGLYTTTSEVQYSGTSMAAPHVAGAAAIYLGANPSASPQAVRDQLVSQATRGVVAGANGVNNHLLFTGNLTGGTTPTPTPVNAAPVAAFTPQCTALTCTFTDASTDSDGSVVAWTWTFGDGTASSTTRSPSHTFTAAGTYAVTLTAQDDKGVSASVSQLVTVSAPTTAPPPPTASIVLSGALRTGRQTRVDLAWTGAPGSSIDVYRNDVRTTSTANDGAYTDNPGKRPGTFRYRVCTTGTTTCSNTMTISF